MYSKNKCRTCIYINIKFIFTNIEKKLDIVILKRNFMFILFDYFFYKNQSITINIYSKFYLAHKINSKNH